MKSNTALDYAVFQLSPRRSRCELFVSGQGKAEKLASGLVKPFISHLKVAEEQVAQSVQSIKLEVDTQRDGVGKWFTKGTVERFVRFVSTPEVLELVNTFDAEMSQLEAARGIYSQGTAGDQLSGENETLAAAAAAAADITKKELLRAIDLRLVAVKQDLTAASVRASAAGFTLDNVPELLLFANQFGAHRLKGACSNFISLCLRRPDLLKPWKGIDDQVVQSPSGSDMSIDDSTEETPSVKSIGPHLQPQHLYQCSQEQDSCHASDLSKSSIPQPKLSTSATFPLCHSLRGPSSEHDERREDESSANKDTENESLPSLSSQQPTRRLSVQDRINMFESKQKEHSGSASSTSKPVVGGKVAELRRLSSDASSSSAPTSVVVERSVLRRWSGASDMSVDLSSEKKENGHCEKTTTSSSSSNFQSKDFCSLNDTATSQLRSDSKETSDTMQAAQLRTTSGTSMEDARLQEQAACRNKSRAFPVRSDETVAKDLQVSDMHSISQIQLMTSVVGAEHVGLKDQGSSQNQFEASLDKAETSGLVNQVPLRIPLGSDDDDEWRNQKAPIFVKALPRRFEDVSQKNQQPLPNQFGSFPSKTQEEKSKSKDSTGSRFVVESTLSKAGDCEMNPMSCQTQYRAFGGKTEKVVKNEPSYSHSQWKRSHGKTEEVGQKKLISSLAQFDTPFFTKIEGPVEKDSGLQVMKLQRQSSTSEQNKKIEVKQDQSTFAPRSGETSSIRSKVTGTPETIDPVLADIVDPAQKVRQLKGNQELNDKLQMKANELEKLFAAHKLRVPGDQMSSARSKVADVQTDQLTSAVNKKLGEESAAQLPVNQVREASRNASGGLESNVTSQLKMVDSLEHSNSLKQLCLSGPSEEVRGKFYERYMQKRDAKLREEWVTKRAQKEAKMKAMHDNLERSKAEMNAKFSASAKKRDSGLHARQRAERLRSFNVHVSTKNKVQRQPEEPFQSDEEGESVSFPLETHYGQDASFNETLCGNGISRNAQSKKFTSNKNLSLTPRSSVAPLPRSSAKTNYSGFGRRRMENPLAQSVPNFSDLRKENTKPSTGITKAATRPQVRNYARSKSTNDDTSLVKEEKPRRSQSMRKSCASPGDLEELSSLNSDSSASALLGFSKDQTDLNLYNKIPKNVQSKPFLRKGNGISAVSGSGFARSKTSVASDDPKIGEESDELVGQPEDSPDVLQEEEEEELEKSSGEDFKMGVISMGSDNGKLDLSQELEKYDPGSENGEALQSLPQVDTNMATADVMSSKFNMSSGAVQGSPVESPRSWNSRMYNAFSNSHDASDIDASADSPIGSPASWNSHSMAQMMDADAARMRKKWSSAQKPLLVANTSHQSRKDVTKGFKRLLKFGRKSKGSETFITDWVSASTASEGDDDTEDGRDLTNRSSEDSRKTRMGFSHYHPYDGFNEGDIFDEQVQSLHSSIPAPPANFNLREEHMSGSSLKAPRSFFSLSSFRSKGSESKLR